MFFPYGIRLTAALNRDFVAWAWAVNGCLSVVGSVLAIILAMGYGFTVVTIVLVVVYWLGVASFVRTYSLVREVRGDGFAAEAPLTLKL
jgi:ABC-type dipeptide/oligopeptide/nickel transport system permease subunit